MKIKNISSFTMVVWIVLFSFYKGFLNLKIVLCLFLLIILAVFLVARKNTTDIRINILSVTVLYLLIIFLQLFSYNSAHYSDHGVSLPASVEIEAKVVSEVKAYGREKDLLAKYYVQLHIRKVINTKPEYARFLQDKELTLFTKDTIWKKVPYHAQVRIKVDHPAITERGLIGNAGKVQKEIEVISLPVGFTGTVNSIRDKFINFNHNHLPEEEASLLSGMIIGYTADFSANQYQAYKISGLLHLVAVSGGNISILILLIFTLLEFLGTYPWIKFLSILFFLLFFAYLVRFEPSVVRASVMSVVALSARAFRRQQKSLLILFYTIHLILLIKPEFSVDLGFMLSAAATAGILFGFKPVKLYLKKFINNNFIVESLAICITANLGTFPILMIVNSEFNVGIWWANLLASVTVSLITGIGFLILITNFVFPEVSILLLKVIYLPLKMINLTAYSVSRWWEIPRIVNLVIIILLCSVIFITNRKVKNN